MAMLEMIQNLAIITSLALVYRVIMARITDNTNLIKISIGFLFGCFTIIGMATPFTMMPGVFYDGRSIILSLAGLFCGPISTFVAAVIAAAYRIYLGGGGVYAGVGTILEASAFGLIFFYLRRSGKIQVNAISLMILGILVHVAMLLFQLLIPGGMGLRVWQEIGVYVLVFFTAATLVIGLLFLDSENQLKDRKALLNSEKTLTKAQQLAQVGSWTWHPKESRLDGSLELFRILDLNKNKPIQDTLEDLIHRIHPDDFEKLKTIGNSLSGGEIPSQVEFRLIRKDGSIRTLWSETGEFLRDSKGHVTAASGIVQDITERRAIEMEILESEVRYRNLIMNSPDAIFVNHEDRIELVNNKAVELFGARDASEILGKPVLDFFHPDFHDVIRERIRLLRETRQTIPLAQEQIIRLDGTIVDVDVISAAFSFHGGDDIHVIVRDITERKQMEKELRESRDLLARLADRVPGAVFQLSFRQDGNFYFPFASPGITGIFGQSPDSLSTSAEPAFRAIHPKDKDLFDTALMDSMHTLKEVYVEFRVLVSGKPDRWYLCSAKPERMDNGDTLWSGILTDITDRKLDEQKIAEQLDELHRWQSVMLGREKRSIELKMEVNALLKELGRPLRYRYTAENPLDEKSVGIPSPGSEEFIGTEDKEEG